MFKPNRKSLARFALLIVSLLILSSLVPPLRNPILSILKYPLSALSLLRREISGIVFYHRNMFQNERLKKQLGILKRKINEAQEEHRENRRFKKLLSLKEEAPYRVIAAGVIGRSLDNWASVIIINKGKLQGIKKGFAVMSYLGLIGKVEEVTDLTSKIILINDPNMGVSAIIARSRQEGLASGTLGNRLLMRYLPLGCDIQVLDTVITSGLTKNYPKGLLIGRVVSIGDEFSGLSRYAVIKPAVDLSSIEEVLVIIK